MSGRGKIVVSVSQSAPDVQIPALNADKCAMVLSTLQLPATVHDTASSIDDDCRVWNVEKGVVIELYNASKHDVCHRLWPQLRDIFHLECAHVREVGGGFSGCIYNWMRPSACPMVERQAQSTCFALDSLE